jgi:hypothetical protein
LANEKKEDAMRRIRILMMALVVACACNAEDITIRYKGTTAKVDQKVKDSVNITVSGAHVEIESLYKSHKLTLLLTGKSDDGQLVLKTVGKAKVRLEDLTLTSQEGAPLWLKNKKKVEVVATKGTRNTLTITACNDTVNHKAATIWAKDKLLLSGKGTLNVIATGDANGKCIDCITIPFSLRRSASLVTCPAFKLGNTYTVKTKGYEKTFTLNDPFTTVKL